MRKKARYCSVVLMSALMCFILSTERMQGESSVLKKEDRGKEVVELQQTLINMGYLHSNATGYYGPLTTEAIKQFQRDFGLLIDGIAGTNTTQQLEDVRKIAKVVHGEARGESFNGQVAVAAVIKNRLQSPEFPGTVEGVIKEKNAFTAVADGQYHLEPNAEAYRAVKDAWQGTDPSQGAHYYYNPVLATSEWIFTRTTQKQIGNHVFAN
ncbi:N-acetylmuramoyl-L-alanine amidase [Alteribacillus persepolensis]|uniref:N-acetylmuramoyl-L-alanine amidase n=1 Tax=Alteribacillus persepolensis TaxID=568899 RepID=A0A1G8FMX4_9BACI|nr:cell wall hydrolase [Alteribacillus persepolensis]SDH83482.1 N-acetylmuramoyl-L-alanine amidase [Alteribacillus persepolensis]